MSTQSDKSSEKRSSRLTLWELVVFAMLGTVMFCSKVIMELLPNIHLLGMFTMAYTIVFRKKALIPIYVYVMLNGLFAGFATWWYPYLYIWTILWAITMILPKKMPKKVKMVVYPIVCCIHGAAFGLLYAPAEALIYGLTFEQMRLWIIAGLPFDILHCIGDFFAGMLILPLSELLTKLIKRRLLD